MGHGRRNGVVKVKLYRIVTYTDDINKFECSVQGYLRMGWKIEGGVSMVMRWDNIKYAQAMTKDE